MGFGAGRGPQTDSIMQGEDGEVTTGGPAVFEGMSNVKFNERQSMNFEFIESQSMDASQSLYGDATNKGSALN